MARDNFQIANRAFQESFQRAKALDLQQQREERFERQLTVNANFQQANLNIQRQRVDLEERRLSQPPTGSFGAVQLGGETGVVRGTGRVDWWGHDNPGPQVTCVTPWTSRFIRGEVSESPRSRMVSLGRPTR